MYTKDTSKVGRKTSGERPQALLNRADARIPKFDAPNHEVSQVYTIPSETILVSEQASKEFAQGLAATLKSGDIVTFSGDLGSGKTFICREIIKYFCGEKTNVASPTFNILQTYQAPGFIISHYDFYRLKSADEIYELGLDEAMQGHLCLIEWPDLALSFLHSPIINVYLQLSDNQSRICKVQLT